MTVVEKFGEIVEKIRKKAIEENRLIIDPSAAELRQLVENEPGIEKTKYGNFVAQSEPTSRAAMFTKNSIDTSFGKEELKLLSQCEKASSKEILISLDRIVGEENSGIIVRLIVPKRFAHLAYGGGNLFLPPKEKTENPTYHILFFTDDAFEENKLKPLPEKDITIRLAMLEDCRAIKIVRNSNYIGEYKKGVFAAEDWMAKIKKGGIFLHAGCREDYLQSIHGNYILTRTLLLALSANGKTTTTGKILARKGNEESWQIQDDGGALMPNGSFRGFEGGGIFVKTERVNPGEQVEIFYGLLNPSTLGENIWTTKDEGFDFYNIERTSNGRAVILRENLMHASPNIEVEKVDNLILITRGPLIPAISKLNIEQTAALMILGQAMESSAGDPTKAGKIRREFFYDPFMAGDRAEHANIFYRILKNLPYQINCYLINTGGIGEGDHYRDIRLEHTLGILDSLLRNGLEDWTESATGLKVPKAIRNVDSIYVHPEKLYSQEKFEKKQKELNRTRREAIEEIGSRLNPNIKNVFI